MLELNSLVGRFTSYLDLCWSVKWDSDHWSSMVHDCRDSSSTWDHLKDGICANDPLNSAKSIYEKASVNAVDRDWASTNKWVVVTCSLVPISCYPALVCSHWPDEDSMLESTMMNSTTMKTTAVADEKPRNRHVDYLSYVETRRCVDRSCPWHSTVNRSFDEIVAETRSWSAHWFRDDHLSESVLGDLWAD